MSKVSNKRKLTCCDIEDIYNGFKKGKSLKDIQEFYDIDLSEYEGMVLFEIYIELRYGSYTKYVYLKKKEYDSLEKSNPCVDLGEVNGKHSCVEEYFNNIVYIVYDTPAEIYDHKEFIDKEIPCYIETALETVKTNILQELYPESKSKCLVYFELLSIEYFCWLPKKDIRLLDVNDPKLFLNGKMYKYSDIICIDLDYATDIYEQIMCKDVKFLNDTDMKEIERVLVTLRGDI